VSPDHCDLTVLRSTRWELIADEEKEGRGVMSVRSELDQKLDWQDGVEPAKDAGTPIINEKNRVAASQEREFTTAVAWQVSCAENASTDGLPVVVIKQPRNLTAILTPIDVQEAWEERSRATGDSLILVWVPPGVSGTVGVERDLDVWMRGRAESYERTLVLAGIRNVRVAWDGAHAVICCAADHLQDAVDAVLRFSVAEWDTDDLERLLASTWQSVEEYASLAHSIRRRQLRRQKRVDALTEASVRMKTHYLRIYQSLEQLDPTLAEPSQRLYSELVLAARLYDRLELLDEPIQFMLDQCEIANTRLMDTRPPSLWRSSFKSIRPSRVMPTGPPWRRPRKRPHKQRPQRRLPTCASPRRARRRPPPRRLRRSLRVR
jgi:hypothetical protein